MEVKDQRFLKRFSCGICLKSKSASLLFFLLIKVLLSKGKSKANATDNENSTPLHAASQEGKLNVIEILVSMKRSCLVENVTLCFA